MDLSEILKRNVPSKVKETNLSWLIYLLTYMGVFGLGFVSNGLLIVWPKLDNWHLAKNVGSLRFYTRWFHFYSWPHVNVGKGFLLGSRAILVFYCKWMCCRFPQKFTRLKYLPEQCLVVLQSLISLIRENYQAIMRCFRY